MCINIFLSCIFPTFDYENFKHIEKLKDYYSKHS